jgi:ABC-type dipeptide/oligopeptide/nickel transport system permease component
VSSLGFNTTITLVLTAPPTLLAGAVGIMVGISSGKYNDRTWHITVMMGIAVVGFAISAITLNVAARYVSCFLFASGKS